MSIVIAKPQLVIDISALRIKQINRLRQLMRTWSRAQSKIERHWSEFRLTTAGRQIPYRVWLRHGAYLEMQQGIHKH